MDAPVTHVRWLKDGEPLKESGGPTRHRVTDHHGNVTLHLKSADLSDKGSYTCEITTKGFPSIFSERASLTVEEKLKFSPQPVDKRLELGSTAKVPCKSQGATNPTVKWIKEGSGEEFPKHVQDINGTLHFNGVLEEDKGRYTCIASNAQGSINHTISIDVVSKCLYPLSVSSLSLSLSLLLFWIFQPGSIDIDRCSIRSSCAKVYHPTAKSDGGDRGIPGDVALRGGR